MGKDLGTYHVRVEFENARGYLEEWPTGNRLTDGRGAWHPLDANRITPTWDDEADMISTIIYGFLEDDFSCDCNRKQAIARAYNEEQPEDDYPCGVTIKLKRLVLIRPDWSEVELWPIKNSP